MHDNKKKEVFIKVNKISQKPYKLTPSILYMDNYEKLLEQAYNKVKRVETSKDRFEIPKVEGHIEGKKTIITNFTQIASYLRRPVEHFQKFLVRELATLGQMEGDRLVLHNKIPSTKINQKIEEYTNEFVLCRECGKPDTEIKKEDRIAFLHCLACGAKHSIRSKI
jgi:translation initiation factor 2 subunit 2